MDDVIYRQDAIDKLRSNLTYMQVFGVDRSIMLIKELSSVDAVKIVRCKDCIYYEPNTEELDAWCNVWSNTTICDGYCFYGERKNEG